jgi:hypothetical protein
MGSVVAPAATQPKPTSPWVVQLFGDRSEVRASFGMMKDNEEVSTLRGWIGIAYLAAISRNMRPSQSSAAEERDLLRTSPQVGERNKEAARVYGAAFGHGGPGGPGGPGVAAGNLIQHRVRPAPITSAVLRAARTVLPSAGRADFWALVDVYCSSTGTASGSCWPPSSLERHQCNRWTGRQSLDRCTDDYPLARP